ncbi:MAG: Lhr family helicase, partial [Candidatus Nanopelagicales bacterium]
AGELPGRDGWVCLAPTDLAPLLVPGQPDRGGSAGSPGQPEPADPLHVRIVDLLGRRGARFLREIAAELSAESLVPEVDVAKALDSLAWQGLVTNDTWEPMRRGAPRTPMRPLRRRSRRSGITRPAGAPTGGRWSLTPASTMSATARHLAVIETLLDRYGIVTREAVSAAGFPGGFAAAYRILTAMEEAGRCRRVYALEGQGAAQFALPGAIDQLRSLPTGDHAHRTLAAADPAQPYGALLSWPEAATRPARTAGACSAGARSRRGGRAQAALVGLLDSERGSAWAPHGARTLAHCKWRLVSSGRVADAVCCGLDEQARAASLLREVACTCVVGFADRCVVAQVREHQDRHAAAIGACSDSTTHVEARQARHHHVEYETIGSFALELPQRGLLTQRRQGAKEFAMGGLSLCYHRTCRGPCGRVGRLFKLSTCQD